MTDYADLVVATPLVCFDLESVVAVPDGRPRASNHRAWEPIVGRLGAIEYVRRTLKMNTALLAGFPEVGRGDAREHVVIERLLAVRAHLGIDAAYWCCTRPDTTIDHYRVENDPWSEGGMIVQAMRDLGGNPQSTIMVGGVRSVAREVGVFPVVAPEFFDSFREILADPKLQTLSSLLDRWPGHNYDYGHRTSWHDIVIDASGGEAEIALNPEYEKVAPRPSAVRKAREEADRARRNQARRLIERDPQAYWGDAGDAVIEVVRSAMKPQDPEASDGNQ